MQFFYFVPGVSAAGKPLLAEIGLADIFGADRGHGVGSIEAGPSGGGGALVWAADGPEPKLPAKGEGDRMRWIPIRPGGAGDENPVRYWLGYDKEDPPRPDELLRERYLPGKRLTLGDGQEWEIPIARLCDGSVCVPTRRILSDEGVREHEIAEGYRGLWSAAVGAWTYSMRATALVLVDDKEHGEAAREVLESTKEMGDLTVEWAEGAAMMAMAVNYRVGEWEAGALGLLETGSVQAILRTIADIDGFTEMAKAQVKKNDAGGSSAG